MFKHFIKTLNIIFAFFGWKNFSNAFMLFVDGDVVNGARGTLMQGNATLGSATEFPIVSVNLSHKISGVIDVTDSASTLGYKDKTAGKYTEWMGSAEAIVKEGETELTVGATVEIHVMASDESGNELYWSGTAIITGIDYSIPVTADDVVKRTLSFEGTGVLTKTEN